MICPSKVSILIKFPSDGIIILYLNCYNRLIPYINNYYFNLIFHYYNGGGIEEEWERNGSGSPYDANIITSQQQYFTLIQTYFLLKISKPVNVETRD